MVLFILCHFAIKPKLTKNKRGIGYPLNSGHIAISKLNEPCIVIETFEKIQKVYIIIETFSQFPPTILTENGI